MSSSSTLQPADMSQKASTLYLYLIVLVAAVGGFLFGYDLSLISGAILFLTKEFALSPLASGTIVGSATLGCCFGPMLGAWMADAWGRKYTLIFSGVLFLISSVGCAYANSVTSLVIWRFVGGLGVGLASTVSPMYIAEIAPAAMRGRLVVLNQLAIVVGLGMSVLVTYWLSFGEHWRMMFASQLVPVGCLMIGLFCVPESPRWLAAVNRIDKALSVLTTINGPRQAAVEISDIQASLKSESGSLRELFRSGVRLALIIGIVLMVFQQINGVNLILIYTPTLFMAAGISNAPDAILNSVFIDGWILVCTIVSFWLTEVVPESWTGRIVNPKFERRSPCPRNDVSIVLI
ncbi:MAG: MFS transporter [Opitutaceae bacterium]|nr:MFS transporter [Opitutaceae bacterium]